MSDLLEQLDTLPRSVIEQFIRWCIWEQARPALLLILDRNMMTDFADNIREARNIPVLAQLSEQANAFVKSRRGATGPLGLSAAEAGTFEFTNMMKAATDEAADAEAVAFFASRVCGWAGWASTDFTDPAQKTVAEVEAREEQELYLNQLLRQESTG